MASFDLFWIIQIFTWNLKKLRKLNFLNKVSKHKVKVAMVPKKN